LLFLLPIAALSAFYKATLDNRGCTLRPLSLREALFQDRQTLSDASGFGSFVGVYPRRAIIAGDLFEPRKYGLCSHEKLDRPDPMARAHFISAASQGRKADPAAFRGLLLLIRP